MELELETLPGSVRAFNIGGRHTSSNANAESTITHASHTNKQAQSLSFSSLHFPSLFFSFTHPQMISADWPPVEQDQSK